jgi:hypothetical protein
MRIPLILTIATTAFSSGCRASSSGRLGVSDAGPSGAVDDASIGAPVTGDGSLGVPVTGDDGTAGAGLDGGTVASPGGDAAAPEGAAPDRDGGSGLPTVGGLFEQPEPWTLDVSGMAPSSRANAILAALDAMGGWGGGKLQIDFSIPLFAATSATQRQTITAPSSATYCYGGPDCDPVPLQMPLPANGNAEGSSNYTCDTSYKTKGQGDCHVLVVEGDQKKLYELYNSTQTSTGFTALGAFVWDLTKAYPDNLRGDQCTSADAAGFPIAALLPTADEAAAGAVQHAIRFILPNSSMKPSVYVHPASHAGNPASTNADAPPYGIRLRLKAAFDESPYNTAEKAIVHAMKTYGMLLSDGGTVALTFADDRTTTAKWAALGVTAQSFAAIAVDDFEVVDLGGEIALTDNCVRNP